MTDTDKTLEEKIDDIEHDDPVKEIFEMMLERIEKLLARTNELEERIAAPPVKPGKRP